MFKATCVTEVCRVGKKGPVQKKRALAAFPCIGGEYQTADVWERVRNTRERAAA